MCESRNVFCFGLCRVDRAAKYFTCASCPGALSRGFVDKKRRYLDGVGGSWFQCAADSGELPVGRALGNRYDFV